MLDLVIGATPVLEKTRQTSTSGLAIFSPRAARMD
jgi:hypothetical protein